ncbi:MAG: hypothetical protein LBD23_10510 [Oscillospiraceae bacterium]|nr:hypothetical protein [Oscillospiraceae bacterium]
MENNFDTQLAQIQTDMISSSLEYCENKADIVYIMTGNLGSFESGFQCHYGLFFRIDGMLLDFRDMATSALQNEIMKKFSIYLNRLRKACEEHDRPIPVIMKLTYHTKNKNLEIDSSYELLNEDVVLSDIKKDWFKSLSNG